MQELSPISQVSLYMLLEIMGIICLILWGLIAVVTIIMAVNALPLPA